MGFPGSSNAARRRASWQWAGADTLAWVAATYSGLLLRYDFDVSRIFGWGALVFAVAAVALHLTLGYLLGPYQVRHTSASFEEVMDVARATGIATATLTFANVALPDRVVPYSVPVIAGLLALTAMFSLRMVVRAAHNRAGLMNPGERPLLVFGAGDGGRMLVRALTRPGNQSGWRPVGLIDDDKAKRKLRIDGVKVLGGLAALPSAAQSTGATALAIAVPHAEPDLLNKVRQSARDADLEVLILPPAAQMLNSASPADLRRLDFSDLLNRRPIEQDSEAIRRTIEGKTVLVTGAGGSIGSELCRQIAAFHPGRLLLLDRDESALHGAQMSLTGRALLDDENTILADIRDADRMAEIMQSTRPHLVFHAAALKHLPLLERYPEEAWKTNVIGTLNVLQAAHDVGVETFVNVSTDKAANPICVLGYSKRLTERLTSGFAQLNEHTYVSVRFGNVLGSRGSVIGTFTAQIERGGPVTVTDPNVERYFMLIPEACQLVLQAASIGHDGEVMVLNMGEPANIADVARTLIELSGKKDIEIVYTGLRPGEKLSEELFCPGEEIQQSEHPLVTHVSVPAIGASEILAVTHADAAASASWMRRESVIDA